MEPMLSGKCKSVNDLKYPVLASVKLDGVRALVIGGRLLTRSLKEIPNSLVQEMFAGLPEGLDGELIVGDPTAPDAYRKTVSAVMGEGNDITGLKYRLFDNFKAQGGFKSRLDAVKRQAVLHHRGWGLVVVEHVLCTTAEELNEYEAAAVDAGHEGIMVRSLDGPYKYGRSTTNEGFLLKVKRFEDAEAVVLDTEELMHNANEATKDNLGHTERSSHQENLIGKNALGALNVKGKGGTYDGVKFSIGTGFQGGERVQLWRIRKRLVGRTVKFKFFPLGSKDRPRFPVFLGWRDEIDS